MKLRCPECGHIIDTDDYAVPKKLAEQPKKKGKGCGTWLAALIVALLLGGVGFWFYYQAQQSEEAEAYENAMKSDDLATLESFLDTYTDASVEHRTNVESRLKNLRERDLAWTNAVVSNSRTDFEAYLKRFPNSEHRAEALQKIDSLDWATAGALNSIDAYQKYLEDHPNGHYANDATEVLKKIKAQEVTPEEQDMIHQTMRAFFQSVNSRDFDRLLTTVQPPLSSFLGKPDATEADLQTYLEKIYKDNVANMVWRLNGDYKINKKEIGDEKYEYTVSYSARQDIEYEDGNKHTSRYRIKSRVNPDGKIVEMNMSRLIPSEQ